ncbi:ABC transporter ATP-binding protein [Desulfofundulus thermosubterraneus]|uniref:ABC-2 type transport system ATP-binding protein n=1 Tax=Desulfofundulus thermosubterraneus DSM 16057 TaxID=1121432 RepID=A0A1M6FTM5_9FIRM|nr:ABC transporter ATP-binding protein [Desulfofundulus thermosubterraneus]SHJ01026.1 ABC-2 type transport system ATP-binding protein [Desulfofundulus thermosubterraneus DSM 16057]
MVAVEVKDVWKKFRLYHDKAYSLKERVIFWGRQKAEDFWALKGVNLTVPKGSTVGLIGRNGSGKSTLLKIISRILYPTRGEVKVNGRVSTLLELGAGFHPDFTGRENVFLNASILGLTRKQTKEKLEEIIAFAELGDFIDNPVRNYSSGMYMRLGFAVAVHVAPDILLIDEVLAVGDLAFQEKCLAKIRELQKRGTTIIFVTHSPGQVEELCDVAVWLDRGEVRMQGSAAEVARAYAEFVGGAAV